MTSSFKPLSTHSDDLPKLGQPNRQQQCRLWRVAAAVLVLAAAHGAAAEIVRVYPGAGNAWHVAAADVTGDGQREIVYACYNGDIRCLREHTGELVWQYATAAFPYDLEVQDLDHDGRPETLVAAADGNLYVLDAAGTLRWKHTTQAPLYQVALARVTESMWVLTGGVDRNLYVLNARGELVGTYPQKQVVRLIGAGDLDADGRDEIVLASHNGKVRALKGPNLATLWQIIMQPLGTERGARGSRWRPYSLCVNDLDGDKRCELIFGSSFYNKSGIRLLNHDGSLRGYKPDGFAVREDGSRYSQTLVTTADLASAPGREVLALNARRFFLFDQRGPLLTKAVAPLPFTNLCVVDQGTAAPCIYLASGPNGDDCIYRVQLLPGWQRALAVLKQQGKMAQVAKNLENIRRQIRDYRGDPPPNTPQYIHIVSNGHPTTRAALDAHLAVIDHYREYFRYGNSTFAACLTFNDGEPVADLPEVPPHQGTRRLARRQLLELLQRCERHRNRRGELDPVPFFLFVGHGCRSRISLETAQAILDNCPHCLGFVCAENENYGSRLSKYLDSYWYPLMRLCQQYNRQHPGRPRKRAIMIEKAAWWATIPAMKRFRPLADGTYADVLVPSVEDSNSRSPELNLAGRVGLYLSGAVDAWSARTIRDELCWNRQWEWEYAMTGHPFLRRQMAQGLLGATIFHYHIDSRHGARFSRIGLESEEMVIDMLGKGLLIPPTPHEMVNTAPVAIRMREPQRSFLAEAFNGHRYDVYAPRQQERDSPFEGLASYWGMAPTREHYIGSYLFAQDRHALNGVPPAPFGFPAIVPAFIDSQRCTWARDAWETDGTWFYDGDGKRLSGVAAKPAVLDAFRTAAEQLPFQLDGQAFMQAQRIGAGAYRVTLIDPGILDPADRVIRLRIRPQHVDPPAETIKSAQDLLSGAALTAAEDHTITLTVPAGTFRIIQIRF